MLDELKEIEYLIDLKNNRFQEYYNVKYFS